MAGIQTENAWKTWHLREAHLLHALAKPRILLADQHLTWSALSLGSSAQAMGCEVTLCRTLFWSAPGKMEEWRQKIDKARKQLDDPPFRGTILHGRSYGFFRRLRQADKTWNAHRSERLRKEDHIYESLFDTVPLSNEAKRFVLSEYINPEFILHVAANTHDLIGLTVYSSTLLYVRQSIRLIRELSNTLVVVGGPAVIMQPEHTLVHSGADLALAGEAEHTLPLAAQALFGKRTKEPWNVEERRQLDRIPGCFYIHEGRVNRSGAKAPRLSQSDLEAIPIDYRLMDREPHAFFRVNSARGCANLCPWCCHIHGYKWRGFSAAKLLKLVRNIDRSIERGELRSERTILFDDDDFFQNRDRAVEFFRLLKKSGLNVKFTFDFQASVPSFFTFRHVTDVISASPLNGNSLNAILAALAKKGVDVAGGGELMPTSTSNVSLLTLSRVREFFIRSSDKGKLSIYRSAFDSELLKSLADIKIKWVTLGSEHVITSEILRLKRAHLWPYTGKMVTQFVLAFEAAKIKNGHNFIFSNLDTTVRDMCEGLSILLAFHSLQHFEINNLNAGLIVDPNTVLKKEMERDGLSRHMQRKGKISTRSYPQYDMPEQTIVTPRDPIVARTANFLSSRNWFTGDDAGMSRFVRMNSLLRAIGRLHVLVRSEYKHTKDPKRKEEMRRVLTYMRKQFGFRAPGP